MIKKSLSSVAVALLLAACASSPPVAQKQVSLKQYVIESTTVQRDEFKKQLIYRGPNTFRSGYIQVFIRAWKFEKDNSTRYQIYVSDYYDTAWRFYNSAYDSNGNQLDMTPISKEVIGCSRYSGCTYNETVGINVTKDYLQNNLESGIRFQISGKAGDNVFYVPGNYIKGFLHVLNDESEMPASEKKTKN